MIKPKWRLISSLAVALPLVLAGSGCAKKSYVRGHIAPVHQQVATLETQINEKFAAVTAKHESDISRANERIDTNDLKLAQGAIMLQQVQATASTAKEQSEVNSVKIAENTTAITTLTEGVESALHYQLVEKADVRFAFGKWTLTPEAKAALDQLAAKVQATPRPLIELVGFTDPIGPRSYNLALSRKRAEAVQSYLVQHNVPLRSISTIGLGEETAPAAMQAEITAPNTSKSEVYRMDRRVHIKLFGTGELNQAATLGSASR